MCRSYSEIATRCHLACRCKQQDTDTDP
ncbi:unnamed protein product [Acanthoscelides obtectus]|uniref:Uncharacterized protein n=1 Tax=Acanthoscelides obtectus TaxID=200917 RepID=A0A9P0JL58_ACAOB|nr:unnamed protein product [Acanthoscelides obtectus]CAK1654960.1 hypothetical protein AOBTE_LOCUS18933 [Acanthoscelides obtectus]